MQRIFTQVGKTADGAQLQLAKLGASQDIYLPMSEGVKASTMAANNLTDTMKRISTEQGTQGLKDKKAADASVQAQSELRAAQQKTMLAEQAFIQKGVDPATQAMKKLAQAAEKAAMALPGYRPGGAASTGNASQQPNAPFGGTYSRSPTTSAALRGGSSTTSGTAPAAPAESAEPATTAAPAAIRPPTATGAATPGYERPTAGQAGSLAQIRELIAGVESKGNYNVVVGGKEYPLTTMTIQEVMNLQRQLIGKGKMSAAGKYQVMYQTLAEVVGKMGLKYDQKFDAGVQDQIADFLIQRRGYMQYAKSATAEAKERFLTNLSKEWAGLPSGPSGESYHKDVGNNKAHIGWNEALAKFGDGGIVNHSQMARVGEKGPEAIITLKNGSVPVTIRPTV
jgi:muramidase (phage lysozyme)